MTNYKLLMTMVAGIFAGVTLSCTADTENSNNPYAKPDDTWISISGRVESVERDSFLLDYGEGVITVEMDDGDRDADAYKLLEGDKVTVNGYIDDDFYELTTIEAGSVYVEKLDTYFYASPADEEDITYNVWYTVPVVPGEVLVEGVVTNVGDEQFTVNNGYKSIKVSVKNMVPDPLDDVGYQKIEKVDIVRVTGDISDDLFESRLINADSVVTLYD